MAKAIPNPEPPQGGPGHSPLEGWNSNDTPSLLNSYDTGLNPQAGGADALTVSQLQTENDELRSIIAELHQELEAASGKNEQDYANRLKEYEGLVDEKSELIRTLHLKMQELEQQIRPATPKEEELLAMSEELERERCQIQQERRKLEEDMRQLKEDEQIMTEEMRKMEIQMAKERADLARQRTELSRINEEIKHELDRIERDKGLSDRLVQLRQRHMEAVKGKSIGGSGPVLPARDKPQASTQMAIDLDAEQGKQPPAGGKKDDKGGAAPGKDSGMFRRFFGSGG